MIHFDASQLGASLNLRAMIDRIVVVMRDKPETPLRQRVTDVGGREIFLMPAMLGEFAGVKLLTVVPANRGTSRPVISGLFNLFSLATGDPLATMDASELTVRRTSAISAAATERLARSDASTLVLLGAGHLAPYMAAAHTQVRPIRHIQIWARDTGQAQLVPNRIRKLLGGGGCASHRGGHRS